MTTATITLHDTTGNGLGWSASDFPPYLLERDELGSMHTRAAAELAARLTSRGFRVVVQGHGPGSDDIREAASE